MEQKQYSINIEQAGRVYILTRAMKGSGQGVAAYKLLRDEVSSKLVKAFPELQEKSEKWPGKDVRREIILDTRQLRAVGHGLIDLLQRDDSNGVDVAGIMAVAGILRIRNYIYSIVKPEAADELTHDLDDEQLVEDEVKPVPEPAPRTLKIHQKEQGKQDQ